MAFVERKLQNIAWDANMKSKPLVGRLVGIGTKTFKDGGKNLSYKLMDRAGTIVLFMGATDLNNKLQMSDVGCDVSIEYLGEDESRQMTNDNNKPKLFKVMVDLLSKQPAAAGGDPGISDADIPF